ncbi:MAG: hypothetical protein ACI8RD_001267 [Bacillariaceae sp.]|jgi:hypothetical protein
MSKERERKTKDTSTIDSETSARKKEVIVLTRRGQSPT